MTWRLSYPILYFLPISICFILHVFLSAGLLSRTKEGFYRYFLYALSSFFIIAYMLVFNQGITLATTRVQLNYDSQSIILNNQYGIVKIPSSSIYAVIVERGEQGALWVISPEQAFYLDQHFTGFSNFLPALKNFIPLGEPFRRGDDIIYPSGLQVHKGTNLANLELNQDRNTLQGRVRYYLPWLLITPLILYPAGQRAWTGKVRYFSLFLGAYFLPILILAFFYYPPLPVALFLALYPLYLLFLNALCLPEKL